ncbi:Hypothetical protein A7982_11161 [Minicystis rosea]|nr:Hypothetical protein A7982_11161 [Minicystis rosea]
MVRALQNAARQEVFGVAATCTMNELDETEVVGESPLTRTMRALAEAALRRIVVRLPMLLITEERELMGEDGRVHELVARSGMLLRGPVTLLRPYRRTRSLELARLREPSPPKEAPASEPHRRA